VVNVAFNGSKLNVSAVPEAGSLTLMLAGLASIGLLRRSRRA
jgi:MYXO-CTERM domain-containing protein